MIVAVSMVRDEEDILPYTLDLMLSQVDHAIIADNLSVDGTRAILESFGDQVTIVEDTEPGYYQADKMTNLAHRAGDMGADWVIPFDADEAWWLPDLNRIDADIVTSRPLVYVPHNPAGPNPITDWHWRKPDPEPQHKVCFRYHPNAQLHMGQHDVTMPGRKVEAATVRHYQYRSLEQVRRKVRNGVQAYDASDLPALYGSHWRNLNAFDDRDLWQWWDDYCNTDIVHDP